MDILGKKAEQASEEVESVVEAVEGLNSHLNALDNAVQQHDKELDQIVENLRREEQFLQNIEFNRSRVEKLKKLFRQFAKVQSSYIENVDVIDSEVSDNKKNISHLESRVSKLENRQEAIFEEIEELKQKIDEVESDFLVRKNSTEIDVDSKVDDSEFEEHRDEVDRKISMLRASINDISDKVEDDTIKTEIE
jgi:chromosome segregation ATPase